MEGERYSILLFNKESRLPYKIIKNLDHKQKDAFIQLLVDNTCKSPFIEISNKREHYFVRKSSIDWFEVIKSSRK